MSDFRLSKYGEQMTGPDFQIEDWLTLSQAAALLNCSRRTIRRRVDSGELDSRVDYQGKQPVRTVRRADILKAAGVIQRREPTTEIVARGATSDNADFVIGQATKVVTGLVRKLAWFALGLVILGGVTVTFIVIGQARRVREEVGGGLSQGLSLVRGEFVTGLEDTRAGLTAEIRTLRAAAEAESRKAAGRETERAAILEAQAGIMAQQNAEIERLHAEIAGLIAGVDALRDAVTRPTPEPVEESSEEPAEESESGGATK